MNKDAMIIILSLMIIIMIAYKEFGYNHYIVSYQTPYKFGSVEISFSGQPSMWSIIDYISKTEGFLTSSVAITSIYKK